MVDNFVNARIVEVFGSKIFLTGQLIDVVKILYRGNLEEILKYVH